MLTFWSLKNMLRLKSLLILTSINSIHPQLNFKICNMSTKIRFSALITLFWLVKISASLSQDNLSVIKVDYIDINCQQGDINLTIVGGIPDYEVA